MAAALPPQPVRYQPAVAQLVASNAAKPVRLDMIVDEHHRENFRHVLAHQLFRQGRGGNDQPVYPIAHGLGHDGLDVVGDPAVEQQDLLPFQGQSVHQRGDEAGVKGVGHIPDDDPHKAGGIAVEALGNGIGIVLQLSGRRQHPGPGRLDHSIRLVKNPGDCRLRYACQFCHIGRGIFHGVAHTQVSFRLFHFEYNTKNFQKQR